VPATGNNSHRQNVIIFVIYRLYVSSDCMHLRLYLIIATLSNSITAIPVKGQNMQHNFCEDIKKQVIRYVNCTDTSFISRVAQDIEHNRLTVYDPYDSTLTNLLTPTDIDNAFYGATDTLMQAQKDGAVKKRWIRKIFSPEFVDRYIVYEEWTYNSASDSLHIQIKAIQPLRNIYRADGRLSRRAGMFFLRYADVQPMLMEQLGQHPENSLLGNMWRDYFKNMEAKGKATIDGRGNADMVAIAAIPADKFPTDFPATNDVDSNTTLFEMILAKTAEEKVSLFLPDEKAERRLADKSYKGKPMNGRAVVAQYVNLPNVPTENDLATRSYNRHALLHYRVIESFTLSAADGVCNIHLLGMEAVGRSQNKEVENEPAPIFLVRFRDIQDLLPRYARIHTTSFNTYVWNSLYEQR
jgi:Gliding motility associated protein GldN